MSKVKFKTNINCTGCLSKVSPVLNGERAIQNWEVDLEHQDRILTIETAQLGIEDIQKLVGKLGFQANPILS